MFESEQTGKYLMDIINIDTDRCHCNKINIQLSLFFMPADVDGRVCELSMAVDMYHNAGAAKDR